MICRDAQRMVDAFFDGELEGRLMREAALHVTRCPGCEQELSDRERIHEALGAAIDEELAGIDPGVVWAGIEAEIGSDTGARHGFRPEAWFRLAAASSRVRGIVLGRRAPASRGAASAIDEASSSDGEEWLEQRSSARFRPWPIAGGFALAASLAAAVLVGRGQLDPRGDGVSVASAPVSAVAMVNPATSQVQVESVSVDSPGRSLAMWTEPETDTTVIWVEDEDTEATR